MRPISFEMWPIPLVSVRTLHEISGALPINPLTVASCGLWLINSLMWPIVRWIWPILGDVWLILPAMRPIPFEIWPIPLVSVRTLHETSAALPINPLIPVSCVPWLINSHMWPILSGVWLILPAMRPISFEMWPIPPTPHKKSRSASIARGILAFICLIHLLLHFPAHATHASAVSSRHTATYDQLVKLEMDRQMPP